MLAHGAETFRHVRESRGVTPDRESVIARDLRGDGCARRRGTEPVLGHDSTLMSIFAALGALGTRGRMATNSDSLIFRRGA